MRIVLAGGSGQVGTVLGRAFHGSGHDLAVLSRQPQPRLGPQWRMVRWDGRTLGDWTAELDGCDVLINLAGRSVNCRYTAANKRDILESRVLSTQALGLAVAGARRPPRVWLQAGTATIYAHRFDSANDEASGLIGGSESDAPASWRFSIDVARAWERACQAAPAPKTRKVILRSAITMGPDPGGPFDLLLTLVHCGLGGRAGDGRQFVSWIHDQDFVRAIAWLIEHDEIDGVVNVAAPNPLPNEAFMKALREATGAVLGLPASRWMLEAGAAFLRTETELMLKSRRVVPRRLLEGGFTFTYNDWPVAARELCQRWSAGDDRNLAA
jgi:uncharacterized protein